MTSFVEELLLCCRPIPEDDDQIICEVVSSSTEELNLKLARYVGEIQKNSALYKVLKKGEWYIAPGKTKTGQPRLFSGENLLGFKVVFVPPKQSVKGSTLEVLRDFDSRYFLRYSTMRQSATSYGALLDELCAVEDAQKYLLENTSEFLWTYLSELRLQYESSGTVHKRRIIHRAKLEYHRALCMVEKALKLKGN